MKTSMNLSLKIAQRYFFSRKKKSFINLISLVAMAGVMVGVMALVVVLSVFNGMEELQRQLFKTFDSDLRVSIVEGKYFVLNEKQLADLQKIEGIQTVTQVVEDNVLFRYGSFQMVGTLKGVEDNFLKQTRLKESLIDGELKLNQAERQFGIMGQGVAYTLGVSLEDVFTPLQVWYPRNTGAKSLNLLSEDAFNRLDISVGGIFGLEQEYDYQYVIVPLSFAESILETGNKRTALEIQVSDDQNLNKVKNQVAELLGKDFVVKDQDEQHASLYKAIKIEKLFVFITLIFIIGIASFNIFFSLSMLVIEKKDDIKTLMAMGAGTSLIQRIFLYEGSLIALIGATLGLILGYVLCLLQANFGLVKMGTVSLLVDAYPVETRLSDFLFSALAVVTVTLLASWFPSKRAANAQ
jgi:lipoprotein-releasing system permease protein